MDKSKAFPGRSNHLMHESLHIQHFAGMNDVRLELRRVNVLIGPQATGKSVSAKLFYLFKGYVWAVLEAVENQQSKQELDANFLRRFEAYFPPESWGSKGFKLRYAMGEAALEITCGEGRQRTPELTSSGLFADLFEIGTQELEQMQRSPFRGKAIDRWGAFAKVRETLLDRVCAHLGEEAGFTQVFVPAGRAFFANLQGSVFSLISTNARIDPFMAEFGRFYEGAKRYPSRGLPLEQGDLEARMDALTDSILKGKHIQEKEQDFLQIPDGRKVAITSASSGQQETLPLAIILTLLAYIRQADRGFTVYIEEPEAHLFPTSQRAIVQLLAMVFNISRSPLQFVVTTHSPYILTAMNNLMQAGLLTSRLPKAEHAKVHGIVPAEQILPPDAVRAYVLEEGVSKLICCEETGLISAETIDGVSNDLSIQFGELLEME